VKKLWLTPLWVILVLAVAQPVEALAGDADIPAKDVLLRQSLMDKIWLFELAHSNIKDQPGRDQIERSYAGFLFQIYVISVKDPTLLHDLGPFKKAIEISALTRLLLKSPFLDDPLNIQSLFFDAEGKLKDPEVQHFGIFLTGKELPDLDAYQKKVANFKQWLNELLWPPAAK